MPVESSFTQVSGEFLMEKRSRLLRQETGSYKGPKINPEWLWVAEDSPFLI